MELSLKDISPVHCAFYYPAWFILQKSTFLTHVQGSTPRLYCNAIVDDSSKFQKRDKNKEIINARISCNKPKNTLLNHTLHVLNHFNYKIEFCEVIFSLLATSQCLFTVLSHYY